MTTISKLEEALRHSWCAETSTDSKNWSEENPSYGQCAVTALIVQDYLGGKLLWAQAELPNGNTDSHYFNLIENKEVDLTREQFPEGTTIPKGIPKPKEFKTTRDYVLSYEPTKERYELLKDIVEKNL